MKSASDVTKENSPPKSNKQAVTTSLDQKVLPDNESPTKETVASPPVSLDTTPSAIDTISSTSATAYAFTNHYTINSKSYIPLPPFAVPPEKNAAR